MNLSNEELCPFVIKAKKSYFYFYSIAGVISPSILLIANYLDGAELVRLIMLAACVIVNGSLGILFYKGYHDFAKTTASVLFYVYVVSMAFDVRGTLSSPAMLLCCSMMLRNHFLYESMKSQIILAILLGASILVLVILTFIVLTEKDIVITPKTMRIAMIENIVALVVCLLSEAYFDQVRQDVFNELKTYNEKTERAVKEKETFFACMSHEIRNPLQSLIGSVDLLQNCDDRKQKQFYLDIIKNGCEIVLNLVSNVLDAAKIQADKMELNVVSSNLIENIDKIVRLLNERANGKNLKLVHIEDGLVPPVLKFDPFKLHQVIINLVSNAIKFTRKGKVVISSAWIPVEDDTEITIKKELSKSHWKNILYPINEIEDEDKEWAKRNLLSTEFGFRPSRIPSARLPLLKEPQEELNSKDNTCRAAQSKPLQFRDKRSSSYQMPSPKFKGTQGLIKIEVMDTGMGIPKSGLERLFQPYHQADPSISQNYGGTGLGLWISKSIVQLMGGDMNIKSKPNFGTNVMLAFPSEICPDTAIIANPLEMLEDRKSAKRDIQCLIVDDNSEHTYILQELLQNSGFSAIGKAKAKEGLELYKHGAKVDLIITDLRMPEMSGQRLISEIRHHEQAFNLGNVPIIVLTGESTANVRTECLTQYGANEYLLKPVRFQELLSSIEKLLSRKKQSHLKNVLIIDDDIMGCKIIEHLLNSLNINSKGCFTIKDAEKEWLGSCVKYDMILLDSALPDGTGLNFMEFYLECIKDGKGKKVPVISMSGNRVKDQEMLYEGFGIYAFIEKPISKTMLKKLIQPFSSPN